MTRLCSQDEGSSSKTGLILTPAFLGQKRVTVTVYRDVRPCMLLGIILKPAVYVMHHQFNIQQM
jgi:hypothetical protein